MELENKKLSKVDSVHAVPSMLHQIYLSWNKKFGYLIAKEKNAKYDPSTGGAIPISKFSSLQNYVTNQCRQIECRGI